jgi:hypothetical protein
MSGMKALDEQTLEFFWRKLSHIEDKDFMEVAYKLSDDIEYFYGNENIPVLVKQKLSEVKSERGRLKRRQDEDREKLQLTKGRMTPERKAEIKKLIRGTFKSFGGKTK